jgi:hypothetical protein
MKKNCSCLIALLIINLSGIAQDLIVRQNGDSIHARITKEKAAYINFAFKHDNEIRNTMLLRSDVSVVQRGYYAVPEVPENQVRGVDDYPRFRVALGGGYSYRLAAIEENIPPAMTEYLRGLKYGFHFQGELAHYFSSIIGLGAYYSITHAKTAGDVPFNNGGWTSTQNASTSVTTHYIGPQFSTRFFNASQRNALLMNISFGYVSSFQETRVALSPFRLTGSTWGMAVSCAYEIGISDNAAIGAKLSGIFANINGFRIDTPFASGYLELEDDQKEGLSRIDLTLYLRFGKM